MSANSKNYNKNYNKNLNNSKNKKQNINYKNYNQKGGEFLIESLKKNFNVSTAIIIYLFIILLICGGIVGGYFLAKSGGGFYDENNDNGNNNPRGHNEQHENNTKLYFGYIIMGIFSFIAFLMLLPFFIEGFSRLFGLEVQRSIFDPPI